MSVIESIRSFIAKCPYLKDGRLNVDYLGDEPTEYTVDAEPTTTVVKRYTDGGTVRHLSFVFASREYFGTDTLQALENHAFYEKFAAWLEEKDKTGELPALGEGRKALSVEALSTGYLFESAASENARYQIQCNLTYYEDF